MFYRGLLQVVVYCSSTHCRRCPNWTCLVQATFVSRNCHPTEIALTERLGSNQMAFKSSSVINLVKPNAIRMQSALLVILPTWAVYSLSLSLSLQILPILYQHLSQRTVSKTSWSNPRQTRICYVFRLWVIIKVLLKQIPLYLLSHFRIRIIVLVCKKSSAEIMRACKITQITMMQGQYYYNWNFSLFPFVWRLESTTTKSF